MNSAFWLGLALAIPLSIIANLATPWFQHRLAQRSEVRRREEEEERARRLQLATELERNPAVFTHLLLVAGLRAAFITAVAGILSGSAFALAQGLQAVSLDIPYAFQSGLYFVGQLVALIGALVIMNVLRDALTTARDVSAVRTSAAANSHA